MKRVHWNVLFDYIAEGRGQGHLEQYRALIRITRRNFPRRSNQIVGVLPTHERRFDFLSRAEYLIALVWAWLGALDIREQFPLWPFAHGHPLNHWPLARLQTRRAPALLDIARDAGIDHGCYPGTRIPYIATTDLVMTTGDPMAPALLAVACKPSSELKSASHETRMLERLELERRYFGALGVTFRVADGGDLNPVLTANLQMLAPDKTSRARLAELHDKQAAEERLKRRLEAESIRDAVWALASDLRLTMTQAWDIFHSLAWRGEIDIDLTRPLHASLPMTSGGRARRAALRDTWMKGGRHA